ncbi:hypothetical protein HPG69_014730 [Diceros bicornis minor]|uniref:Uncharacterized protein n=1 Tax=Diceros bicornis minor TaxID=77932 RepID=A0A7J7EY89_DICBM|nr:hypothetical protein HPG69_014730 [Diceros bicornis minor]
MTWVSTTVISSTALNKKTMTAEQQTRGLVGGAYSCASLWTNKQGWGPYSGGHPLQFAGSKELSTSFPEISGTNLTPQSSEITALPVSVTFSEKPNTQTDVNSSPPTFMPDVSTPDLVTRRSVSSASYGSHKIPRTHPGTQ